MNTLSSFLLVPLTVWDSIGAGLNTMMQPIYWVISGIIVGFHWLFSQFMDPNSGWTWTLAIVSLTVVIRTLMIPLFVRQINTSRKMQLLGPKLKALQDKYGADRERLGQETMKMYREENVNPAASCLPILLQMPIFIGLFNVLNFVSRGDPMGQFFVDNPHLVDSLRHATIFGAELSGRFMPITTIGPTQFVAAFLIIAMTVTLFITQLQMMRKNMPPEALEGPMAQQQKMMLYMFPVIYLFTGIAVPIGVMIYWLASNLWTLGQQYILVHNSPAPNTPAYLDWEDRMKAKGKDPDAIIRKRLGVGAKPRATQASDPTRVARQSMGNDVKTSRSATKPTGARKAPRQASEEPTKKSSPVPVDDASRIRRQQPSKQSRARRKAKPKE